MKRYATMATVLLAVGAVGFGGCKDEDGKTPGQRVGEAVDATTQKATDVGQATTQEAAEAGRATTQAARSTADEITAAVAPSGANRIDGIRNAVEGVVTNALDKNNWEDMLNHFTKADRDRLMAGKPDTADLDALIGQVTDAWRNRYSDAFTVMAADKVYNDQFMTLTATTAGGGKTGSATIVASHGRPELKFPAVEEDGKWRIDVPDDVDAKRLHANLLNVLKDLQKTSADWPGDKTQAYQHVSHRIMMAVMNKS